METFIRVLDYAPSSSYLANFGEILAIILALFIPLSLDIVARTSAKFQTESIGSLYKHEISARLLPPLLIILVVLIMIVEFAETAKFISSNWRIISLLILILTIVTFSLSVKLFVFLKNLILDSDYVYKRLKRLYNKSVQRATA